MNNKQHRFADIVSRLVGSPMFEVLRKVQELERAGKSIIHFEIGDPDFNTPRHVIQAALDSLNRGDTHYVNSFGIHELRDAVADSILQTIGFQPDREQVVVAPAISFIYFITQALVNPGEEVIVSNPDYASYFSAFDFVGVQSCAVTTFEKNNFRLRAADVEKCITPKTRLMIINSPQNPTGALIEEEELKAIYGLAQKHNFYIISDEVYGRIIYDTLPRSIATNDQCKERVIILNSFSKTYAMTGWRLGYAIAPKEIIQKLGLMIETVISNVPAFIQHAGVAALTGDQSSVGAMVQEYQKRRDFIVAGLNTLPGVRCMLPDGAFYAFPNIEGTGLSSVAFAEKALSEAGVAVLPGINFGSNGEGHVRISFATSHAYLEEGLKRLRNIF